MNANLEASRDRFLPWAERTSLMADRVFQQLPNSQIFLPAFQSDSWYPFDAFCYYSDDEGRTWQISKSRMMLPDHGAQEPTIVEDGKRCAHGCCTNVPGGGL